MSARERIAFSIFALMCVWYALISLRRSRRLRKGGKLSTFEYTRLLDIVNFINVMSGGLMQRSLTPVQIYALGVFDRIMGPLLLLVAGTILVYVLVGR